MSELYTEVEIQASAERVWNILIDFDRYPQWNPFLIYAHGEVKAGARLEVCARPSGAIARTFFPTVHKVAPNRELRWLGRLLMPHLLDGEHIFTIEEVSPNQIRLIHREHFSGLLVPFHRIMRFAHTRRGFEEMNQALKIRAEQNSDPI